MVFQATSLRVFSYYLVIIPRGPTAYLLSGEVNSDRP